jgi:hypothetical protein
VVAAAGAAAKPSLSSSPSPSPSSLWSDAEEEAVEAEEAAAAEEVEAVSFSAEAKRARLGRVAAVAPDSDPSEEAVAKVALVAARGRRAGPDDGLHGGWGGWGKSDDRTNDVVCCTALRAGRSEGRAPITHLAVPVQGSYVAHEAAGAVLGPPEEPEAGQNLGVVQCVSAMTARSAADLCARARASWCSRWTQASESCCKLE